MKLSKEALGLKDRIKTEYGIVDEGGLLLLQTAFEAFDMMRKAQRIINKDGLTFKDRFYQVKTHPLCNVVRDARAQFLQALKQLNLDIEPLKGIGRPGS